MSELLNCPFCGGIAETNVYGATGEWIVKCPCGAEMNRLVYTEAEAIEAWNTRAERTCEISGRSNLCSRCGALIERVTHSVVEMGDLYACSPIFCPSCGAKVVYE